MPLFSMFSHSPLKPNNGNDDSNNNINNNYNNNKIESKNTNNEYNTLDSGLYNVQTDSDNGSINESRRNCLVENEKSPNNSESKEIIDVLEKDISKLGEADSDTFPEGGKGWLVILGTFFLLFCSYGMMNAFGVYQTFYENKYPTVKSSVITIIGSLQPAIIYAISIFVEIEIHYIGALNTIRLGSLIIVFSFMMLSLTHEIWQVFLVHGVLFGIGASMVFFPSIAVPAEWFKRKRALALGITASGSSFGGVIWPIVIQRLISKVGFPWTNRIVAFMFIPLLTISCFTVIPRFPKSHHSSHFDSNVLKNWKFLVILLAQFIGTMGLYPPVFYLKTYALRLNLSPNITNYILSIYNASSIIGRILPGRLGDQIGRLNVLTPATFFAGFFQLVVWLPVKNAAGTIVFAILYGLFSGAFISLVPAVIGQMFGIKGNRSRLSIMFMISFPPSLIGAPIAALWIPTTASNLTGFTQLMIFSSILLMAAGLILAAVRISVSPRLKVFI